jgi:hypothetical protein
VPPVEKCGGRHCQIDARAVLARDGREHAIKLLDALNAPWTLVDAAWTPKESAGVSPRRRKRWLSRRHSEAL